MDTIKAWVDDGAKEGDPSLLPAAPVFVEGWRLGKPDIIVDIGKDFVTSPGNDAYEHFTVPTNFTEGKWIRAAEIRPGNRKVVHHVHVSLVANDGRGRLDFDREHDFAEHVPAPRRHAHAHSPGCAGGR